jgi:lysophospholipase L1-like esterase
MAVPTKTTAGLPLGVRAPGTKLTPELTGTIKILACGDSITAGTGSTDGGAWRTRLDTYLDRAGIARQWVGPTTAPPGFNHYGNSSWEIGTLNGTIGGILTTYTPDAVILLIGRNDMDDGTQAANAPTAYGTLLGTMWAAYPDTRVLACHITPEESATFWPRTQTFRAALPAVLQASSYYAAGRLIECYGAKGLSPLTRAHLGDGTHPNDLGYRMIADGMWPSFCNLIGRDATW